MSWKGFKQFLKENGRMIFIAPVIAWTFVLFINFVKHSQGDVLYHYWNFQNQLIGLPVAFALCFVLVIFIGGITGEFKE